MSDAPDNKEYKPGSFDGQSPLSEEQRPATAGTEGIEPGRPGDTADAGAPGKAEEASPMPAALVPHDDAVKENEENGETEREQNGVPSLSDAEPLTAAAQGEHEPAEPDTTEDAAGPGAGDADSSASDSTPAHREEKQEADEQGEETAETDGLDDGDAGENDDDDDDDGEEEEEDEEDRPMTLRDHFRELRKRFLFAFLWALAGFSVCYPFAKEISEILLQPLIKVMPQGTTFIYTTPAEAFFTELKIAFVAGIFVTSPLVFYQVWAFVAPGLYKEEKLYVLPVSFFSALFFVGGGLFCYLVVFPLAFTFFMSYSTGFLQAMLAISSTLSFVLQLLLAFGLVFELPLFVFFLARLGIVTADMMRKFRRYAILVMVIVAAILTPPDVMSQMLMAGPLLILYELSIFIAALFGKKKAKPEDEDEEEEEEEEEEDRKRIAESAS